MLSLAGPLSACCPLTPPTDPRPFAPVVAYTNGLDETQRRDYYHLDEGIQYLPIDVLLALARPVLPEPGASALRLYKIYDERLLDHPERLGLYPDPYSGSGVPIGISISKDAGYVPMAGINCATCHTSVWTFRDNGGAPHEIIVDGGSSLFAIDRFVSEMLFSLLGTVANPAEMIRFYERYEARVAKRARAARGAAAAAAVTGPPVSAQERILHDAELKDVLEKSPEYDALKKSLEAGIEAERLSPVVTTLHTSLLARKQKLAAKLPAPAATPNLANTTLGDGAYPSRSELNSGFKMFVYLVKRVKHFVSVASYATAAPTNATASGLGRSNPWSVTANMLASAYFGLDKSAWPKATNAPINTPHIWGYGTTEWVFWSGVTNSMIERNLAQGIALLTDFNWNKSSYETTVSVRKLQAISELAQAITPPRWPAEFGTPDPALVVSGKQLFDGTCQCNSCHAPKTVRPGPGGTPNNYSDVGTDGNYVAGQRQLVGGKNLFSVLAEWLGAVKQKAYQRETVSPADQALFEIGRTPVDWRGPTNAPDGKPWSGIEAKPLQGIWASPPYLHNGAVLSIRQLLTKPNQRLASFYVGNPEYDTKDLGFKNQELVYTGYDGLAVIDTTKQGNSSAGHDYCTTLTPGQQDALIEYLKTY